MSTRRRWPWVLGVVVAIVVALCGAAVVFRNELRCDLPLVECLETGGHLYVRNDRVDEITIRLNSSNIRVRPGQMMTLGDLACGDR